MGCSGLGPLCTPKHTRGYSCCGATIISNTRRGLGRGKSKCCRGQIHSQGSSQRLSAVTVDVNTGLCLVGRKQFETARNREELPELRSFANCFATMCLLNRTQEDSGQQDDEKGCCEILCVLTLMSMNLCMGSYHCRSTTLVSRAQHRNTQPRCTLLAGGSVNSHLADT